MTRNEADSQNGHLALLKLRIGPDASLGWTDSRMFDGPRLLFPASSQSFVERDKGLILVAAPLGEGELL